MQFRLRDFAQPIAIFRLRRFLEHSQYWTDAERQTWQTEQMRELLTHARETSPFWRQRIDASNIDTVKLEVPGDLQALPVLSKDDVRRHEKEMVSSRANHYQPRPSSTSGSTGTALRFLLDAPTNRLEFATLWRQFNVAGYRFGQRFADLRGHLIGHASGIERDLRLNSLNLSAFHLTREKARDYVIALERFRPVMVRGYPSSISLFATWALEEGLSLAQPAAVVTSSETLLEAQRDVITRAFGCPVFDYYGQMERVAFAGQCERGSYHVASEYGFVELLDEHGQPVTTDGEAGRIIATGFHHRAMPLIRYDTGDHAVHSTETCACGRTGPLFRRIIGRQEDFVITPDGRHVGRLDAAFKDCPGISRARIVQTEPARITVEIIPGPGFGETDRKRLLAELTARLGTAIEIEVTEVEDIALERSGKFKFVVSSVPVNRHRAGGAQ